MKENFEFKREIKEEVEKEKEPFFYEVVQLDTRKPLEEQSYDFGIEVTLDGARNDLDHHSPNDTRETPSACEQALALEEEKLPSDEAKIGILRPDADTLTAIAVLNLRKKERKIDSEIVKAVGALDRLGPKEGKESYPEQREKIIAIWQVSSERGLSLENKLEFIQKVLEGDLEIEGKIKELVEGWENRLEEARKSSEINLSSSGRIAQVIGKHSYAMNLGYEQANIVVATNPEMPILEMTEDRKLKPTGEIYLKHTVARANPFISLDIKGLLTELNKLEEERGGKPSWGGRGDIIGSPIGVDSKISSEELLEIVEKYITEKSE